MFDRIYLFDRSLRKCNGAELYLSEIEEEAGVLASLREVGEKHCDADEENRGVLAHLTQRLRRQQTDFTFNS